MLKDVFNAVAVSAKTVSSLAGWGYITASTGCASALIESKQSLTDSGIEESKAIAFVNKLAKDVGLSDII